ncbi:putative ribonuclease H-like domain-containing protein, partial [Tanacetum coccineum]
SLLPFKSPTNSEPLIDNIENVSVMDRSIGIDNPRLEVMEFEYAQSNTTAKLPILKLGEYEMWVIRIKQYFLVQDYALWEVIENAPVTAEEKTNKKNDVNARSLLLMALFNEHQLTFSQYSDAKIMFAAIEIRFGGNEATKKTQRHCSIRLLVGLQFWMNKADIETMSIDDLYNNFKIVEQDVKKSVGANSGAQNLAFFTTLSTSSTNDVNTANLAYEVSNVSHNINTVCPQVSTANFSDNIVYAFMVENPNGFNLLQPDLEKIHEDDLEAMDLKWQLSLLSMTEKRYFQRTCKKIFINANDTTRYDKSKVECFNCHKMGHFARECRAPRNKEGQFKYQDNTRKQGNNEDTSSKAMLAIDGVAATYKRGLATVEEQLITYRKNEVLFSEEVAVLKREVACKDYEINMLKSEFEKVKQEKEGIEFKIEKFDNASKSLNKLLESQITDKSKKGLGYNVVPPPHPLIYNRPKKLDLSYSSLDSKTLNSKVMVLRIVSKSLTLFVIKKSDASKENSDDSLVKEQVSEDTSSFVESPLNVDKETIFLVDKKIEFVKPEKIMINQLKKSLAHVAGSLLNTIKGEMMVYGTNYNWVIYILYYQQDLSLMLKGKTVSRAVLMKKTGLKPFNIARTVNNAHPKSTGFSAVRVNQANVVKASACWVWRPTKLDSKSITLKKHNYIDAQGSSNFDMKNIVPKESLTCLVAKATSDESMLWHRRLGHINFKNINKLVKDNLDEISKILKNFIKEIENLVDKKVKIIRSDNGIEFKNKVMDDFCKEKGIKREYSVARTPQQNGVAKRRNRTLSTQGELNAGTSTQKEEISQDCIVMPIWKDNSYFDSPSKDVDKSEDDSSPKEVNATGQHVNTASPEVNIGRFKHNIVDPSVNTASSYELDSPKDMFKLGVVPTTPNTRIHKDHPIENVIGDVKPSVQTRRMTKPTSEQGFLRKTSTIQTPTGLDTCGFAYWKEGHWKKNGSSETKKDERGIVIRNKARLVAQSHRQEEVIDYEEVFAPVARIKAIRLFLAYASFMGFLVYQMDVKSAFLYGTIEEEVYVTQPPGFKDPDHPDKVYKVVKALYGLHQAPRAWYETLANYLLGNGFKRGKIDQTLFIKKQKGDILLVQVYVDDIIFGSTNKELCTAFEKLMKDKFQMSSMGELTFFLGLQVTQKEDGIFISQDKYVAEILKKFNYTDVKSASTPVDLEKPLVKDGVFASQHSLYYSTEACVTEISSSSVTNSIEISRLGTDVGGDVDFHEYFHYLSEDVS